MSNTTKETVVAQGNSRVIPKLPLLNSAVERLHIGSCVGPNDAVPLHMLESKTEELNEKLREEVFNQIKEIMKGAPEAFDSFIELAEALKENKDGVSGIIKVLNEIKEKYPEQDKILHERIDAITTKLESVTASTNALVSENRFDIDILNKTLISVRNLGNKHDIIINGLQTDSENMKNLHEKNIKEVRENIKQQAEDLTQRLAEEEKARKLADDAEAAQRKIFDAELTRKASEFKATMNERLEKEISDRETGDKAIQGKLNAEIDLRTKAEAAIRSEVESAATQCKERTEEVADIGKDARAKLEDTFKAEILAKEAYYKQVAAAEKEQRIAGDNKLGELLEAFQKLTKEQLALLAPLVGAKLEKPNVVDAYIGSMKKWRLAVFGDQEQVIGVEHREDENSPWGGFKPIAFSPEHSYEDLI